MIIHFRLYRERVTQIEKKLAEVKAGRAPEYLQPLEELQVNMKNRMEVSSIMRELRLSNITCKFDAEQLATEQNFEVRSIVQCGSPSMHIDNFLSRRAPILCKHTCIDVFHQIIYLQLC